MIDIKPVLEEWHKLYKEVEAVSDKKSNVYRNVTEGVQRLRRCGNYILFNLPAIKEWCEDYLSANRKEVWLRFWLSHASEHFLDKVDDTRYGTVLSPNFAEEWAAVMTGWVDSSGGFDVSIASLKSLMNEMHEKMDVLFCDVPEIRAIHEGLECVSNGWYCDYCDDTEFRWHRYLRTEIKKSRNIFLNREIQEEFVQGALADPDIVIPETWRPPVIFPQRTLVEHTLNWHHIRQSYTSRLGGTPIQYLSDVLEPVTSYTDGGWWFCSSGRLYFRAPTQLTDFLNFFKIWPHLTTLAEIVAVDLKQVAVIEQQL